MHWPLNKLHFIIFHCLLLASGCTYSHIQYSHRCTKHIYALSLINSSNMNFNCSNIHSLIIMYCVCMKIYRIENETWKMLSCEMMWNDKIAYRWIIKTFFKFMQQRKMRMYINAYGNSFNCAENWQQLVSEKLSHWIKKQDVNYKKKIEIQVKCSINAKSFE